jgi:hypothetical protein
MFVVILISLKDRLRLAIDKPRWQLDPTLADNYDFEFV